MRWVKCVVCAALLCACLNIYTSLRVVKQPQTPKPQNYFIAANYFDSEVSLMNSIPELVRFMQVLEHGGNLYLSIFENGSEDKTADILDQFGRDFPTPHSIVTCNFTGSYIKEAASDQEKSDFDLNRAMPSKRYSRMAVLRNLALKPLYDGKVHFENPNLPTKVIFLNDIYFTAEQILELLLTNNGNFDIACGLDFYELFYDTLVTRDVTGYWFSGLYPYTQHEESRQAVLKEEPFQVYSCWNGVAVMRADPFLRHNVRFRSRVYQPKQPCECIQSECLLICRDFHDLGFDKVYLNPRVRVTYTLRHFWLYNTPVLTPLFQWMQSLFFSPDTETHQGIGCGMPPEWSEEEPLYMQPHNFTCALPFDTDRPDLNDTEREFVRESAYLEHYSARLAGVCLS